MRRNPTKKPPPLSARSRERLLAVLQRHALRSSKARDELAARLVARPGHFRVEDVLAELPTSGQAGSRATLYRTLPLLVEAGLLQQVDAPGGGRAYESAVQRGHHDHLVCRDCGTVVEFHFEAFEMLQRDVAAKYGFELVDHHHRLVGVCGPCQAKLRTSLGGEKP